MDKWISDFLGIFLSALNAEFFIKYLGTKGLNKTISQIMKKKEPEIEDLFILALDETTQKTCEALGIEYDEKRIYDVFSSSPQSADVISSLEATSLIARSILNKVMTSKDLDTFDHHFACVLSKEKYSRLMHYYQVRQRQANNTAIVSEIDRQSLLANDLYSVDNLLSLERDYNGTEIWVISSDPIENEEFAESSFVLQKNMKKGIRYNYCFPRNCEGYDHLKDSILRISKKVDVSSRNFRFYAIDDEWFKMFPTVIVFENARNTRAFMELTPKHDDNKMNVRTEKFDDFSEIFDGYLINNASPILYKELNRAYAFSILSHLRKQDI